MTKISELSSATAFTGTEEVPVVQTTTKKGLLSQFRDYILGLSGPAPLGYVSGRYYGCPFQGGTLSTTNIANGVMHFVPVYVFKTQTFTGVAYWATASTPLARFGIYTNSNGAPGTLVTGTDTAEITITTGSTQDVAFAAPVSLSPGWYWIAVLSNGTATLTACASNGGNQFLLGSGVLGTGSKNVRCTASQTYGALPASAPAATLTDASGMIDLNIKAQ